MQTNSLLKLSAKGNFNHISALSLGIRNLIFQASRKISFQSFFASAIATFVFAFGLAAQAGFFLGPSAPFGPIVVNRLIVMPDPAGHIDWINSIGDARISVHMTMYHLTDPAVIKALIDKAQDKSVDVRILVDGKSLVGGYAKAIQTLIDAGVQVKGSSPAFSLTHSKDMVIDGNFAFIGAIDMTNTATRMRDFAIVTTDHAMVSEIESVFATDWNNAQSGAANTPAVNNANLAWSPTNSASQLAQLINSARSTLVAETENFNNTDIIIALNAAVARGVKVRLIVPECSYGNADLNYKGTALLRGVAVHMEHDGGSVAQPYLHSKMMMVDGQTVYLGSINFSFNSILNDRELGAIFQDQATAQRLAREFELDWSRSQVPASSAAACTPSVITSTAVPH